MHSESHSPSSSEGFEPSAPMVGCLTGRCDQPVCGTSLRRSLIWGRGRTEETEETSGERSGVPSAFFYF